ncbi:signal peptidase I [Arcanobacterium haemolyticum]|nr:signal peptidase I [Arcanobacterium haemolyticum]
MADGNESDVHLGDAMPPSFPPEPGRRGRHEDAPLLVDEPHNEEELDESADEPVKRSRWRSVGEFALVLLVALVISALVKTFLMQAFYVPSSSMETTLMPGDRIAVNRLVNTPDEVRRGDVVVFVDPGGWLDERADTRPAWQRGVESGLQAVGLLPQNTGHHLVKRVIGVGGDTVACCTTDGKLTVNGEPINESYLRDGVAPSQSSFSVTVPEGHLWVMGDNRSDSKDSRYHQQATGDGFVPVDNVVGRAWAIFYPFSRMGTLPSASDVFAEVP